MFPPKAFNKQRVGTTPLFLRALLPAYFSTKKPHLQAFLQKICKISSLSSVIRIALEETETNITFTDAMQYVKYLPNLDLENIKMGTIPGEGGVFFVADEAGVAAMVQEYVYGEEPEETTDSTNTESMNSAN